MKIIKYSDLSYNVGDAAYSIIDTALKRQDATVGLDLGSEEIACFEIRFLDDDEYYLKEYLMLDSEMIFDDENEGEWDEDSIIELITYRLQTLDQVTDYPRLPSKSKAAIQKAVKLVDTIVQKYDPDQPRDDLGRFGSGGGSSEAKPTSNPAPKITTQDSQRSIKIDDSKLGAGQNRLLPREEVLSVYAPKVSVFNPGYSKGSDNGAVFNMKWKNTERPANYPKDVPHNPRPQKAKEGDFSKEYTPWASKDEVIGWMKEGDLGAHKARVMLHELYDFARQRQGSFDQYDYTKTENVKGNTPDHVNRWLEKHKLTGFDVDIHHMIPASIGGSNKGANLVALTPAEHTIAHILEWSAAKDYDKNGNVAKQGKWGGKQGTFSETAANIKANNIYRAITMQTTAAVRSGNKANYFKEIKSDPSRRQAAFATQKALSMLKKLNLVDTDDITKLKLDSTGRPKWTSGSKANTIKELEKLFNRGRK